MVSDLRLQTVLDPRNPRGAERGAGSHLAAAVGRRLKAPIQDGNLLACGV